MGSGVRDEHVRPWRAAQAQHAQAVFPRGAGRVSMKPQALLHFPPAGHSPQMEAVTGTCASASPGTLTQKGLHITQPVPSWTGRH